MNGKFQRSLGVLVVSALFGLGVWKWCPGTALDRATFSMVAGSSVNGTLFISGLGSHADAWKLRSISPDVRTDRGQAPVIVSLGDDLQGFFQSSPPAPIDMAVIFSNFHRLGAKKAATAAVLAWEKPDPIGLAALEKSLSRFESLVMAAPLSRGVVASPMPVGFRRTSVPVDRIRGDVSVLPLVNRLPIPGIILGGETTIAGFSVLESETPSRFLPLIARWEDRVVFSFSLLTVLQRLDLPLEGVEIRLGEFLKLGPAGPIVPVDEFGRLKMPAKAISGFAEISAEALIDGGDDLFPKQAPDPVILRDDQSAAEAATRAFSKSLSAVIASITSNGGLSDAHEFPRLAEKWEIALLALCVLTLTALAGMANFSRYLGVALLVGGTLAAQWIACGSASVWLPGLPLLAAIVGAQGIFLLPVKRAPEATPPVAEIPVVLEPVPAPLTKPAVKKVAARKTAAKKEVSAESTPKKTAAKKAARKTPAKPRSKKAPEAEP